MKKRSDNTLESDATKTIIDKTEINAPDSNVTPQVTKITPKRKTATTAKKSVKTKVENQEELKLKVTKPIKGESEVINPSLYELNDDEQKIIAAKHHDPFAVLGRHDVNKQIKIKVYLPYAETVSLSHDGSELVRITGSDFFEYLAEPNQLPEHYELSWIDKDGYTHKNYDPYD